MGPLGRFLLAAYRLAKAGVKKDDILKFAFRLIHIHSVKQKVN